MMFMTDETSEVAVSKPSGPIDDLLASGALDELFAKIDAGEIEMTGDGGLIPSLIKAALERGLQAEMADHVGYDKGAPEAALFANSRNGTSAKTVASQVGDIELAIPRDRDGSFTPRLVPKGSRRLGGLDDMIISLYAGGMTIRDIQHHLVSTIGTDLSHETISKITDAVADEVLAWQRRPLDSFYPVMYLDALVIKVKDGGHVGNKAAHIAIGVDLEGIKHVLGIWVQTTEGAKFWASVCADMANRGVRDVLIVCCDGLTGFPEAIEVNMVGGDGPNVCGPPDPGLDAVHQLQRPQSRREGVETDLSGRRRGRREGRVRGVQGLRAGHQISQRGRDLRECLGTVHPIPGLPSRSPQGHLHDQLDRVAELPTAQDHQEPRPLPQRRSRCQTAVVGDLQHRRQTSTATAQGTLIVRRANAKHPDDSSKDKSRRTGRWPSPNSRWPIPTDSTPTSKTKTSTAYTKNLTGSMLLAMTIATQKQIRAYEARTDANRDTIAFDAAFQSAWNTAQRVRLIGSTGTATTSDRNQGCAPRSGIDPLNDRPESRVFQP